jgi:putative endonuclease
MQASERYAVYIMASRRNGTLYVGVTNNITLRAYQHRIGAGGEFTRKYGVARLVWYELHSDINEAIIREKRIKKWERRWKLELIESFNPDWADLYDVLNGCAGMTIKAVRPRSAPRDGGGTPDLKTESTFAPSTRPDFLFELIVAS